MHACHQQVIATIRIRVPLHSPCTASDIRLYEGPRRLAYIKESYIAVVTAYCNDVLQMWVTLNACYASFESFIFENWLLKANAGIPAFKNTVISAYQRVFQSFIREAEYYSCRYRYVEDPICPMQ